MRCPFSYVLIYVYAYVIYNKKKHLKLFEFVYIYLLLKLFKRDFIWLFSTNTECPKKESVKVINTTRYKYHFPGEKSNK